MEQYADVFYFEGGRIVESDTIDKSEGEAWFVDSFKYHTGRNPTQNQIKRFLSGKTLYVMSNKLEMSWDFI